jgi:hypothetical protein
MRGSHRIVTFGRAREEEETAEEDELGSEEDQEAG